ncbi:hypothetical protein [Nonomuraea aurantiaca]|uniref:hypothetical protein n=1 Tax=Nonomuraea aurantiaca TaxID=2878562 RepID=UPI001CD998D2|nr:hypothetical protein [Nonomuraea aurantiaca]MCA2229019.1 hypothetical protein [Nonomuraea aurantiaca]
MNMLFMRLAAFQQPPSLELILLERLQCRLIETERVVANLRPELEALLVYGPQPCLPVHVFVGYGGRYFSWQNAEKRHLVDDIEGAAEVLAAHVRRDEGS